jgi:hypothetical protein
MTMPSEGEQAETNHATETPVDVASVLSKLLKTPERRSFKIVVQEGRLLELAEIPEANSYKIGDRFAAMQRGWISLKDAAKRLAHGYCWLSRSWRGMGLRPRKIGHVLFFREADIAALIERQRPLGRGPGRPRKVVGVF